MPRGFKSHNRFLTLVVILVAVAILAVVGYYKVYNPYVESQNAVHEKTRILMDTNVNIRAYGRNADRLIDQAFAEMERLENVFSRHIQNSEVASINAHAGEWVEVSLETIELVNKGLELGEITHGAFDITIGALIDLWGFSSGQYRIPSADEISAALATVDFRQVEVDESLNRVRIPEGTVLDLGGIAKGFIVDRGQQLLADNKVRRAIVNAGGDISVIGKRPDGTAWRVGVQNPDNPAEIRWILPLENNSVVTSGDYQRYFVREGQRWHHILDPKTGYPARGLRSVTIVADNAALGDALSTAVFVLGMQAGSELVEQLPDIDAIVAAQEEVWISPGLRDDVL